MDRNTISVIGLIVGMLGSLFLSYDLLGKPGGVLRRLVVGSTAAPFGALLGLVQQWTGASQRALTAHYGIGFYDSGWVHDYMIWTDIHSVLAYALIAFVACFFFALVSTPENESAGQKAKQHELSGAVTSDLASPAVGERVIGDKTAQHSGQVPAVEHTDESTSAGNSVTSASDHPQIASGVTEASTTSKAGKADEKEAKVHKEDVANEKTDWGDVLAIGGAILILVVLIAAVVGFFYYLARFTSVFQATFTTYNNSVWLIIAISLGTLLCEGIIVFVTRLMLLWSDTWDDKVLGSFGALMTLVAFAVQLGLQVSR